MVYFLSSYSLLSTSTLGLTASYFSSFSFPSNSKIRCMDAGGLDSDGREFNTAEDMWREQAGDPSKKTQWYRDGVSYWEVPLLSFSFSMGLCFTDKDMKFIYLLSVCCCKVWFLVLFVCMDRVLRQIWMGYWEGLQM